MSKAPLTESFAKWANLKIVLLALFGATAGQAVVWYGGQFYALLFLEKTLQVDSTSAQLVMAAALLIATPFFVVFGSLSDKIGRKKIVLTGCLLAALTYFPIFQGIAHFANPALDRGGEVLAGDGGGESGGLQLPVRPDRQEEVHERLRPREGRAGAHGRVVLERGCGAAARRT